MRFRRDLSLLALLLALPSALAACGSETTSGSNGGTGGTTASGGTGGTEQLGPGELCDKPAPDVAKLRFEGMVYRSDIGAGL